MNRFAKIGPDGQDVADESTDHVAVRDNTTQLVWSVKEIPVESWQEANEKAAALDLLGAKWRLPTVEELFPLADRTTYSPAIDTTFFPDCQNDWYWTSTPAADSPSDYAWVVLFGNGHSDWSNHGGSGFVRAVRVSQ